MELSISSISMVSILAPAIVGLLNIRNLSVDLRILLTFVLLTLTFSGAFVLLECKGQSGSYLFHYFAYIEFTAIAVLFFRWLDTVLLKSIVATFFVTFVLYSIFNVECVDGVNIFDSNQRYIAGLMIIFMCVSYFAQLMRRAEHMRLEALPSFWLTSSFLIYFSGTLFLFLVGGELIEKDLRIFWEIYSVLNIGLNGIYVVAILKGEKRFKAGLK